MKALTSSASQPGLRVTTGELYAPIDPYSVFYLPVGGKHVLYVEQSGKPDGIPVVVLHGGPGAAPGPSLRQFFNPDVYRIIIFHQRGCGKSKPLAELQDNTTWHLVADIESIRRYLGIANWHVFGGSWGSTLALTYAIKHPQRVRSLVLRGIFLGRREEVDWFYERGPGVGFVFPEAYEKLAALIPPSQQGDMVLAYHKRLTGSDQDARIKAAIAWSQWEASAVLLWPSQNAIDQAADVNSALAVSCLENWYFMNGCFFPGNKRCKKQGNVARPHWILRNIDRIRHIPAVMCDGRYDMDCPIKTANDLFRAWPEAQFVKITDSGHSAMDPPMSRALVRATDWFGLADRGGLLKRDNLASVRRQAGGKRSTVQLPKFEAITLQEWVLGNYIPAATFKFDSDEIARRLGITFIEADEDGLGRAKFAFLRTAKGTQFIIRALLQAPSREFATDIQVLLGPGMGERLDEALAALGCSRADLNWVQEAAEDKVA